MGNMKGYERLLQLENHAGVDPTAGLSLDVPHFRIAFVLLGPEVNYYVKHLVQNADGGFNQALEWIVEGAGGLAILRPIFTRTMDWMDWMDSKLRSFHIVPHLQELYYVVVVHFISFDINLGAAMTFPYVPCIVYMYQQFYPHNWVI